MVDKVKIEQAVRLLLEGIGEDITREGLIDTPDRIARMCEEIYGGLGHEADQHLLKIMKSCWKKTSPFTPCVSII